MVYSMYILAWVHAFVNSSPSIRFIFGFCPDQQEYGKIIEKEEKKRLILELDLDLDLEQAQGIIILLLISADIYFLVNSRSPEREKRL